MPDASPILVFGPAYLDRVIRVDRPLVDPTFGGRPLDGSVDGRVLEPGDGLTLMDPLGNRLTVELPEDWPGPTGIIALSRPLSGSKSVWSRQVRALGWQDDLGGMGAGFASATGGELISALGPEADPNSRAIARLLEMAAIAHHPIRVDHPADWTLLFTSGEHGDKLPIGFRGGHSALLDLGDWANQPTTLRLVAALPNRLACQALQGPGRVRAFAPSLRNMLDREPPLLAFADSIDVLSCNRGEWEALPDPEAVARNVSILAITDGSHGAILRFTTASGEPGRLTLPAFPRARPPRDTNRAGEAFAANLLLTLLQAGWTRGATELTLARHAAERALAAAALVLDRLDFGFPTPDEIDEAAQIGWVD